VLIKNASVSDSAEKRGKLLDVGISDERMVIEINANTELQACDLKKSFKPDFYSSNKK
jgi:hypothetical protein